MNKYTLYLNIGYLYICNSCNIDIYSWIKNQYILHVYSNGLYYYLYKDVCIIHLYKHREI